jgi:hypothetical protein
MKNMKLFMLNVDIIPVSMEVKMPNFRIAFADSNSNAKSNPLIKLFFAILRKFGSGSLLPLISNTDVVVAVSSTSKYSTNVSVSRNLKERNSTSSFYGKHSNLS